MWEARGLVVYLLFPITLKHHCTLTLTGLGFGHVGLELTCVYAILLKQADLYGAMCVDCY